MNDNLCSCPVDPAAAHLEQAFYTSGDRPAIVTIYVNHSFPTGPARLKVWN